jgi:zinc/manganese transport system permease protein
MNSATFTLNIFNDLQSILQYDFMRHAFEAGTIIAIMAGIIGYFIVIRKSSFAAHALSHIGFTGAAGAVLIGMTPLVGLLSFTIIAGVIIAVLGKKASTRDTQIGIVLAFMLGLGALFISLYSGYASEIYSLLFGEILGISNSDVLITLIAGIVVVIATVIFYRPLLFYSLDEDVAEAKGVPVGMIGIIFMILVAIATSMAVQVVGVLLIFALMIIPSAIAQRITKTPKNGILVSIMISLLSVWVGLFASFYIPYPVSFFITTETFLLYIIVLLIQHFKNKRLITILKK